MPPCDDASPVFLYGARYVLLVLHAAGSIVLVGASTHPLVELRHYLRGRFNRAAIEKLYAKIVAASYVVTFGLGALLYPSYRVHVRALVLDRHAPGFSGLFDVKEVWASLALVVALALGALAFTLRPAEERWALRVYAAMSALVCAVVWFDVVAGLLVVARGGVG